MQVEKTLRLSSIVASAICTCKITRELCTILVQLFGVKIRIQKVQTTNNFPSTTCFQASLISY